MKVKLSRMILFCQRPKMHRLYDLFTFCSLFVFCMSDLSFQVFLSFLFLLSARFVWLTSFLNVQSTFFLFHWLHSPLWKGLNRLLRVFGMHLLFFEWRSPKLLVCLLFRLYFTHSSPVSSLADLSSLFHPFHSLFLFSSLLSTS